MLSILLASKSSIKLEAVEEFFPREQYKIDLIECDGLNLPPQPMDSAPKCAKARLNYAKKSTFPLNYDYYIAIENGLKTKTSRTSEKCYVLVEHKGLLTHSSGEIHLDVPLEYLSKIMDFKHKDGKYNGYSKTIGDVMHEENPEIDPKNWIKSYYNVCRKDQIKSSLRDVLSRLDNKIKITKNLISKYKEYPNYPKQGVIFQDFFSVIREADDIRSINNLLADQYKFDDVDYIVGPESRGFFGYGLSVKGNYGFIPLRKKGKLPGKVESITYKTEYSSDTLECPTDIPSGSRVVIFDDLIATGGSLRAACDLLERSGCEIVDCVVLREVLPLRKVAQETLNRPYKVLLQD